MNKLNLINKLEDIKIEVRKISIETFDKDTGTYLQSVYFSLDNLQNELNIPEIKEGFFKRLWNKTIFPDKIAKSKAKKKMLQELKDNAEKEALNSQEYKDKLKQEAIRKLSGEDKKDKLDKFANAFSMGGGSNTEDKISRMLGSGSNSNTTQYSMTKDNIFNNVQEKILGPQPVKEKSPEEKIREMIGFR